jgi:hypothetical protein
LYRRAATLLNITSEVVAGGGSDNGNGSSGGGGSGGGGSGGGGSATPSSSTQEAQAVLRGMMDTGGDHDRGSWDGISSWIMHHLGQKHGVQSCART